MLCRILNNNKSNLLPILFIYVAVEAFAHEMQRHYSETVILYSKRFFGYLFMQAETLYMSNFD